jgi:hypothetical protein
MTINFDHNRHFHHAFSNNAYQADTDQVVELG